MWLVDKNSISGSVVVGFDVCFSSTVLRTETRVDGLAKPTLVVDFRDPLLKLCHVLVGWTESTGHQVNLLLVTVCSPPWKRGKFWHELLLVRAAREYCCMVLDYVLDVDLLCIQLKTPFLHVYLAPKLFQSAQDPNRFIHCPSPMSTVSPFPPEPIHHHYRPQ